MTVVNDVALRRSDQTYDSEEHVSFNDIIAHGQ